MEPEQLLKTLREALGQELEAREERLDKRFEAQEERLDKRFQERLGHELKAQEERLDKRFEERLGHVQVLLEGVQGDIKALAEGLEGYRYKMDNGLGTAGRERGILDRRLITVEAKTDDLDRRVGRLEN